MLRLLILERRASGSKEEGDAANKPCPDTHNNKPLHPPTSSGNLSAHSMPYPSIFQAWFSRNVHPTYQNSRTPPSLSASPPPSCWGFPPPLPPWQQMLRKASLLLPLPRVCCRHWSCRCPSDSWLGERAEVESWLIARQGWLAPYSAGTLA